MTFHDNLRSCHFGGVPEAEVPYDIAWVNVGDLGSYAAMWRGTQPGSLRSWNPSVKARDFSPFFLAFQRGKDEIPLGCRWRWKDMDIEEMDAKECCVIHVYVKQSLSANDFQEKLEILLYKRHINVFICTNMCTMMCSIKIALTLGVHHPRGMVYGFGQVHSLSRSSHQKMGGQSRHDASHIAPRASRCKIWSDGGADPLKLDQVWAYPVPNQKVPEATWEHEHFHNVCVTWLGFSICGHCSQSSQICWFKKRGAGVATIA